MAGGGSEVDWVAAIKVFLFFIFYTETITLTFRCSIGISIVVPPFSSPEASRYPLSFFFKLLARVTLNPRQTTIPLSPFQSRRFIHSVISIHSVVSIHSVIQPTLLFHPLSCLSSVFDFADLPLSLLSHPSSSTIHMQHWPCPTCKKICRSPGGLTQHVSLKHRHYVDFRKRDKAIYHTYHPLLNGESFLQNSHISLTELLQELPVIVTVTTWRTAHCLKHRKQSLAGHSLTLKYSLKRPTSFSRRQRCLRETLIFSWSFGHQQCRMVRACFKTIGRCW